MSPAFPRQRVIDADQHHRPQQGLDQLHQAVTDLIQAPLPQTEEPVIATEGLGLQSTSGSDHIDDGASPGAQHPTSHQHQKTDPTRLRETRGKSLEQHGECRYNLVHR